MRGDAGVLINDMSGTGKEVIVRVAFTCLAEEYVEGWTVVDEKGVIVGDCSGH